MAGTVCSDGGGRIYYRTPGYGGGMGELLGLGRLGRIKAWLGDLREGGRGWQGGWCWDPEDSRVGVCGARWWR